MGWYFKSYTLGYLIYSSDSNAQVDIKIANELNSDLELLNNILDSEVSINKNILIANGLTKLTRIKSPIALSRQIRIKAPLNAPITETKNINYHLTRYIRRQITVSNNLLEKNPVNKSINIRNVLLGKPRIYNIDVN